MKVASQERGQALILIVFAIIGLFGITGLAVDGGMAYSDRRYAQNAADNAALAAALANSRGKDANAAALGAAKTNGFNNNGATNTVKVTMVSAPGCPFSGTGKDITVQITSKIQTYFGTVVGIRQITNVVEAVTRSCTAYSGPPFPGNAIVALGPTGTGFNAVGTTDWKVEGGGIFSNSSSSPSVDCKGAASVDAPALTAVGTIATKCDSNVGTVTPGAAPYAYEGWSLLMPATPDCLGTAIQQGGYWYPDSNPVRAKSGSRVAFIGDMTFKPGLYCVTNSPGSYHGTINGTWVTFYLMRADFAMKFNGGGNLTAQCPATGDYAGVLMFSSPVMVGGVLQNTQAVDLRGNGTGAITGSVLLPSASITLFGNSSGAAINSQIVGYNVNSGGNADIYVNYDARDNFQTSYPGWLNLLK